MRFDDGRESSNVEDRRGEGGGGVRLGGGRLGLVGTIVLALVATYFGVDPRVVLDTVGGGGQPPTAQAPVALPPKDDAEARFVSEGGPVK